MNMLTAGALVRNGAAAVFEWAVGLLRWLYIDLPLAAWGWVWDGGWQLGTRVRLVLLPWFLAGFLVALPNGFLLLVERGVVEATPPVRAATRLMLPLAQRQRAACEKAMAAVRALTHPTMMPVAGAAGVLLLEILLGGPLWVLWHIRRQGGRPVHVVNGRRVRTPSRERHQSLRAKAQRRGEWFIGTSATGRGPVQVGAEARVTHTWVVGKPGTGKTLAVLLPQIAHDIQAGHPVVFIDGKGDHGTAGAVFEMARRAGREEAFRFLDLRRPSESCTYSPMLGGSPNEQADKIMAALRWDNEYYRSQSHAVLIRVLRAAKVTGLPYTLDDVVAAMSDPRSLRALAALVTDPVRQAEVNSVAVRWEKYQLETAGMRAQLETLLMSEFGELLHDAHPTLDLAEAYRSSQIVYLALPVARFPETAPLVAKLIIGDLNAVAGIVQDGEIPKGFASVVVDEFAAFAMPLFIDLLNKARSAGMAITIAHQSMRCDLVRAGEGYAGQVADNTNIKIVLQQSEDAEYVAGLAGTRSIVRRTEQTSATMLGEDPTGLGSAREADEYQVSPNVIRELPTGMAVVKIDQPVRHLDVVAFDFMDTAALPAFRPGPQSRPAQVGLDLRRRAVEGGQRASAAIKAPDRSRPKFEGA